MNQTPPAAASGTPEQRAAALIPGPQMPSPDAAKPAPEPAPNPAPTPQTGTPAMRDAIEAMRAKREKAAQEQSRAAQLERDLAQARAEAQQLKTKSSFEDDPVGYAQARGWTKDQQLMFGQALLYDLAPDKADPNFRVKMFEDKQKRQKAADEAAAQEQQKAQEAAAARQEISRFAQVLEAGVASFDAGSYPASEDEYGDNVEGYLQAMFRTAVKMADEATKANTIADLSPQAIAAKLEADTVAVEVARQKRRSQRTPPKQSATAQPSAPVAKLSDIDTTSTQDLGGSGAPLPPARTESERKQRALAILFPSR